jgi:hypothetical protein
MVCHLLSRSYLIESLLNRVILKVFNLFDRSLFWPFWILIVPFLYTFVTGYGPVQGISEEFWLFLITLGLH